MADPRFHGEPRALTVGEIASLTGAAAIDATTLARSVTGIATLADAGPSELSFLDNRRYLEAFRATRAGACLVRPADVSEAPRGTALLTTDEPYFALALALRGFYPETPVEPARHPTAWLDPTARIDPTALIEAGAVIGPGAEIGARCHIGANAVVAAGVAIGPDSVVRAGVSLACCVIGAGCTIHEGARIGSEGFGFATRDGRHLRVAHVGRVMIGDNVEIGANSTVDRGTIGDTVIGTGTVVDNLVQIAHNVVIGRGCVIAGQVGIAGSTRLGDHVVIGGQAGLVGHVTVGDRVVLAARSGVKGDLAPDGVYAGAPAVPIAEWRRQVASVMRAGKQQSGKS